MISIGIKNLTANTLYVKELQVEVSGNSIRYLNAYDFFTLAKAQSLKDHINAGSVVILRDSIQLSQADSLAYVTSPSTTGGEINTASNVGTGSEVFKVKTGEDLEFRRINSTQLSVTQNALDITLTGASPLISAQASVTPAGGMEVLLNDSGTLKRGDVATFLGGGSAENIRLKGDTLPCGYGTATNSYNAFTMTANYWYGLLFWVGGEMNVTHIGIQSSASMSHDIVGGIYKYVYASDSWTKVVQVGPFTNGVTGMQSVALGSTEKLEQGVYMMAMLGDGAQTNISGHYVQYLQNMLPGFQSGTLNKSGFYLYNNSYTYTATLPATIASGVLSVFPYTGHGAPCCYLTLG